MTTRQMTAAAVALLVSLLAACGDDESHGDADPMGEVVPGRVTTEVSGDTATVRVPTGELSVTVGEPITGTLPAEAADDATPHDAPDGGSLVPVEWRFDALAQLPGGAVVAREPQPTSATMRFGGEEVALPEPYRVRGHAIVDAPVTVFYVPAQEADPAPVLAVTYDGHTQVLDVAEGEVEPGVAEMLYDDRGGPREARCTTDTQAPRGGEAQVSCQASVERVPYLPGAGWAEEGEAYVVVGHRLTLQSLRGLDTQRVVRSGATRRLDGAAPIGEVPSGGAAPGPSVLRGLDVYAAGRDADQAVVTARFHVRAEGGEARVAPVRVRAVIDIPGRSGT